MIGLSFFFSKYRVTSIAVQVVQYSSCHAEPSEPLGRWPKGKASIPRWDLAGDIREILPLLRSVRMTRSAVFFALLDNCYIILFFFFLVLF